MKSALMEPTVDELRQEREALSAQFERAKIRADAEQLLALVGSTDCTFAKSTDDLARLTERISSLDAQIMKSEAEEWHRAERNRAGLLASAIPEYFEIRASLPALRADHDRKSIERLDARRFGDHAQAQLDGWRRSAAVQDAMIYEPGAPQVSPLGGGIVPTKRQLPHPPPSIDLGAIERAKAAADASMAAAEALSRATTRLIELETMFPALATIEEASHA